MLGISDDREGDCKTLPNGAPRLDKENVWRSKIRLEARQNGGDAVIFVSSASQLAGYYTASSASAYGYGNSATAFGSSTTVPITRRSSTYVVIRYLD